MTRHPDRPDVEIDAADALVLILNEHRRDDSAFALPMPQAATTVDLVTGAYVLMGYVAVFGSTGGTILLFDGGVQGLPLATEVVNGAGSLTRWFGPGGIGVDNRLTLLLPTAPTNGAVFLRHRKRGHPTFA